MLFSNFSECCILRRQPDAQLSCSQWTLVLELADRYCMDSLRKHAIEKMQSVRDYDPVDKVVAARRSKIKQWLLPSFDETPRRPKSLNQHDVDLLGLEAVLRLASIRERIAC